jgi:hypothetical protein
VCVCVCVTLRSFVVWFAVALLAPRLRFLPFRSSRDHSRFNSHLHTKMKTDHTSDGDRLREKSLELERRSSSARPHLPSPSHLHSRRKSVSQPQSDPNSRRGSIGGGATVEPRSLTGIVISPFASNAPAKTLGLTQLSALKLADYGYRVNDSEAYSPYDKTPTSIVRSQTQSSVNSRSGQRSRTSSKSERHSRRNSVAPLDATASVGDSEQLTSVDSTSLPLAHVSVGNPPYKQHVSRGHLKKANASLYANERSKSSNKSNSERDPPVSKPTTVYMDGHRGPGRGPHSGATPPSHVRRHRLSPSRSKAWADPLSTTSNNDQSGSCGGTGRCGDGGAHDYLYHQGSSMKRRSLSWSKTDLERAEENAAKAMQAANIATATAALAAREVELLTVQAMLQNAETGRAHALADVATFTSEW